MHKYLRAIGFSELKKPADLDILLKEVREKYDQKKVVETKEGRQFAEFTREFAPDCGIKVCGEFNEKNEFVEEYHFPFLLGSAVSSSEEVIIERQSDKESFIGACDDLRLDLYLIFQLVNTADYLNQQAGCLPEQRSSVLLLSALSVEGKILLPILHSAEYVKERQKKFQRRTLDS